MLGGIRTCLEVRGDPIFLCISSNSCPLNVLLVRSRQAEIIIKNCIIQKRNNVTRVGVEPRCCDQVRRNNNIFALSAKSGHLRRWRQFGNSCPLNVLLVRSRQAEIIIKNCIIQKRNNVTRVGVEPRCCDQVRRNNNIFALSAKSGHLRRWRQFGN